MATSYDLFSKYFLLKIKEYSFAQMLPEVRIDMVDSYLRMAVSEFEEICTTHDLTDRDECGRVFNEDIPDIIVNIVSDGMVKFWLRQYVFNPHNLENYLNTRDFTLAASPANVLKEVRETYELMSRTFTQGMREYSYRTGDLTSLHM